LKEEAVRGEILKAAQIKTLYKQEAGQSCCLATINKYYLYVPHY